jgi:hypothetical protein
MTRVACTVLRVCLSFAPTGLMTRRGLEASAQVARLEMGWARTGDDVVSSTDCSITVLSRLALERPRLEMEALAHR